MVTEAYNLLKGYCVVEAGTVVVNPLYYQEKDDGKVELFGKHRADDGQTECLADQMSAVLLFVNYTTYILYPETFIYSIYCFATIDYLDPMYPSSSRT